MDLRPLTSFATAAFAVTLLAVTLSGQAARAFTFNNADGSSGASGSGSSGYKDIDVGRSRLNGDSADSTDKSDSSKPKTGFYFGGPASSMDQRYSGDRYFSPNNLMGR